MLDKEFVVLIVGIMLLGLKFVIMTSRHRLSYLHKPINPFIADYDSDLRGHSNAETLHWFYQEKAHKIQRADWRSQRKRRSTEVPTNEYIWHKYGLLHETRLIPRVVSSRGSDYQSLVSKKVLLGNINIVIVYKATIQNDRPESLPCVFYIHGGCRYGGTPYSGYLERVREWANHFDVIAVSVEYRLSPNDSDESPTGEEPTNDCFDALNWVHHHLGAEGYGILKYGDRAKIIVVGTSAGGGLAASVVMKWCRERREEPAQPLSPLYGLILEAPQLDDRCNTQSHVKYNMGNMFSSGDALLGWSVSLGVRRGTENVSIFEAPARALDADVQGFPPTFIDVGATEPFRDEVVSFSNMLHRAKVDVEMHVWDGGFHGFASANPKALVSRLCNLTKLRWLCHILGIHDDQLNVNYQEIREAYMARATAYNEIGLQGSYGLRAKCHGLSQQV